MAFHASRTCVPSSSGPLDVIQQQVSLPKSNAQENPACSRLKTPLWRKRTSGIFTIKGQNSSLHHHGDPRMFQSQPHPPPQTSRPAAKLCRLKAAQPAPASRTNSPRTCTGVYRFYHPTRLLWSQRFTEPVGHLPTFTMLFRLIVVSEQQSMVVHPPAEGP